MADMSLSERYDYLKAAKASIYNNVREGRTERDGAGLKIKGASGKAKETLFWWQRQRDRGFSTERAGVGQDIASYEKGATPYHGSAVPVPETTAFSVASASHSCLWGLSVTTWVQAVPDPRHTGELSTIQAVLDRATTTQGVLQDSPGVCLQLDVKKKAISGTGREKKH